MGYGALDAVNTPNLTDPESTARLLAKIQQIGRLVQHGSAAPKASEGMSGSMPSVAFPGTTARNLILLGASTGGPDALGTVLKDLPPSLDAAIVIVQHVDHVFAQGLADWLGTHTGRRVELAAVGTAPLAGHAYLAAGEDHLVLTRQGTFAHQREPQDSFYRPSVDVLFESAARHWPQKGAAALLTGMGRDGARGLLELKEAGWLTLAQDEGSCVVYGMPKAAVQLGAPRRVLPLNMIGNALAKCFAAGGRSV
jgi:chemotaxis response regulator CheB